MSHRPGLRLAWELPRSANGHMAVTASPHQGAEPSVKMAGLPARSMSSRSWAHDARAEIGKVWRTGRCREPVPYTRGYDPCDEIRVPAPAGRYRAVGDTPGRFPGSHCPCRYGWSWPEPPAGVTPHHGRMPPSSGQDRGLRAAGVANG